MTREPAALTRGPVPRTLARMAGGMMIGMLAMAGFNIVDTYFVSWAAWPWGWATGRPRCWRTGSGAAPAGRCGV